MRRLLTLLLLLPGITLGAGLQDEPVGTRVNGTFQLGYKRVYVPSGEWTLIAGHRWTGTTNAVLQGTNFAGVYLAEIKDGELKHAVQAWGNIDPNLTRGWRHPVDPCKRRENVLAYKDFGANPDNQLCYDVSELRGYMKKSTAWRQQAQQWLEENKIKVPPTVLMVRFAKLERAYWTEVYYYFQPQEFAGATVAEKAQSAAQWAEELLPRVREGLSIPGP
jgi:hypothetical protein